MTEELFHDPDDLHLLPEEEAVIADAVEKRRREFGAVRHCARTALARLGHPPVALLPGEQGAPQWPSGVVGSMTHCNGYRAAAVGRSCEVITIGIDAEPHRPLPAGVLASVARPEELGQLSMLSKTDLSVHWDTVLWSCKESVYKAWFPLTGRRLDFEDASVTIDPVTASFSARLLVSPPVVAGSPLRGFYGRWVVGNGLLVSAIGLLSPPGRD